MEDAPAEREDEAMPDANDEPPLVRRAKEAQGRVTEERERRAVSVDDKASRA